jgi:hypothetical protein
LRRFRARAMLVTNMIRKGVDLMTSQRILQLNAVSTAICALGMLATRQTLYSFFGLGTPLLLDAVAVGLLAYAGALAFTAARQPITPQALMVFTVADGLWVAASVVVLLLFWGQLAPVARWLIIAVGLAVEIFATLQFRAARKHHPRQVQVA